MPHKYKNGVIGLKLTKRDILFYLAAAAACSITLFLMFSAYQKVAVRASADRGEYRPTIVLDAGHGGEDGGAVSKSGLQEKDVNLAITHYLKEMLTATGFDVVMTRDADISINDDNLATIKERKVSDLHNRLKIINSYEDCIFLSIHQNQFSDSKYSGAQMFYSTNNPASKELAESLKQSVVTMLQPENNREIKPAGKSIYLLWNSKRPSVIVECGFLSNEQESLLLADDTYQRKMAFSIYCGFLNYWRSVEAGSTLP